MNSLREESNNLTTKIVEIRMSRSHPNNDTKVFILLEGKTDIKLSKKIFSYDDTEIYKLDNLKIIATDKLQICNGHDLTLLIANCFSEGNINQGKIEEALRLSYSFTDFEKTNLFTQLNLWAETNNYKLFNEI